MGQSPAHPPESVPPEARSRAVREALDDWHARGLIAPDLYARLLADAAAAPAPIPGPGMPPAARAGASERKLGRGVTILFNLGAIVLAAGLIIFFASNWVDFGRPAKIASLFALDGRLLWRIPRFQGLSVVLPDGDSGGGWAGALRYETLAAGLFRYTPDGRVARLDAAATARSLLDWQRSPLGPEAYRSEKTGRLYVREHLSLVILAPDGALVRRIEGVRFDAPRQGRS